MAKVLVQHLWCDPCQQDEATDVDAITHIVGVVVDDRLEPREIELCKVHADAPHSQVQMWALDWGREHIAEPKSTPAKVKPPTSTSQYNRARDGRLKCPYCDETRASAGRVDRHIRMSHEGQPLGRQHGSN